MSLKFKIECILVFFGNVITCDVSYNLQLWSNPQAQNDFGMNISWNIVFDLIYLCYFIISIKDERQC